MKTKPIDLCDSCEHVQKVVGYGRQLKRCGAIYFDEGNNKGTGQFPVESCTEFKEKGTVSLRQMENMAVYIEKKKDAPGFVFTKHLNGTEKPFE